jgi:hypothetical protein
MEDTGDRGHRLLCRFGHRYAAGLETEGAQARYEAT